MRECTHPHAVAGRVLDLVSQRLLVALAALAPPAALGHGFGVGVLCARAPMEKKERGRRRRGALALFRCFGDAWSTRSCVCV
jgi:hypothetical protein